MPQSRRPASTPRSPKRSTLRKPPRKEQAAAEEERVKPVVPAEQSLVESHTESTLPDLKPVGE